MRIPVGAPFTGRTAVLVRAAPSSERPWWVQAVRAEAPGVHALDIEVLIDLTRAYYREVQDALDWLPDEQEVLDAIRVEEGSSLYPNRGARG